MVGDYISHTERLPESVIGPLVREEARKAGEGPDDVVEYGLNEPLTFYDPETGREFNCFVSWWRRQC